ncbi:MAG TPA: LPS export ABC transporter ATP-binding protein [Acidobacteriota bacterium]
MRTLSTDGLVKWYGGRRVVSSVSISVSQGEVVGLLGPNGAGKTTTFHMLVGLVKADAGSIRLEAEDLTNLPMYLRARKGIGYLPQEPSIFRKLTVEENILAILETLELTEQQRRARLKELLEELGTSHLARQKAFTLSGGERRRVEITRALVTDPSFFLLDEPFTGIDPIAIGQIQKIIAYLRSKQIGLVITDHNVRETLKITDRAYIIREGQIFRAGTPLELASDPEVRRVFLGENFTLN